MIIKGRNVNLVLGWIYYRQGCGHLKRHLRREGTAHLIPEL